MRNATYFFILLILALLAACVFPGSSSAGLEGAWTLTSINGQPPIAGSTISATFENGEVGGRSGCNSYGGKYSASGKKLSTSALMMTEMACMDPQGVMEQEAAYLQALSQAASFTATDGRLEIRNASGETILVFTAD